MKRTHTTGDSQMLEPRQERSHATRRRLLDAAVQQLVQHGYGGLTTSAVARSAGVSRGAQQHHFPSREALVIETVRYMSINEFDALQSRIAEIPAGRSRVEGALDLIFETYAGAFFRVILELSMATRQEPILKAVIAEEETIMTEAIHRVANAVFDPEALADANVARRWTTALATIRGIAILPLLGHSPRTVANQWNRARGQVLAALLAPSE